MLSSPSSSFSADEYHQLLQQTISISNFKAITRLEISNYHSQDENDSSSLLLLLRSIRENLSFSLRELSLVNLIGLTDISELFLPSVVGVVAGNQWKNLRVLDLRKNSNLSLATSSSFLLVNFCPFLYELRLTGLVNHHHHHHQHQQQQILIWIQAMVIGHLEIDFPSSCFQRQEQFCNEICSSCLFNVSISLNNNNNQRFQLSSILSLWSLEEMEERFSMIEKSLFHCDDDDQNFLIFLRIAMEILKSNNNNNLHQQQIPIQLQDSSLANSLFDLKRFEQEKWYVQHHQHQQMKMYFTVKNNDHHQQHQNQQEKILPFLLPSNDPPEFILIKCTGSERRRLIMKSIISSSSSSKNKIITNNNNNNNNNLTTSNFNDVCFLSPSPEPQQQKSSSSSSLNSISVLHQTMKVNNNRNNYFQYQHYSQNSVRKFQQYSSTSVMNMSSTKRRSNNNNNKMKQQENNNNYYYYCDDDDDDNEDEQEEEEKIIIHHSPSPSPTTSKFRNKILHLNRAISLSPSLIILDDDQNHQNIFSTTASTNNIHGSKINFRPSSSSSTTNNNNNNKFKLSEFIRSEKVSIGDPIIFLSPAAFGVGEGKFTIVEIIMEGGTNNNENDNFVIVVNNNKNKKKKLSVKMKDINRGSESWVSCKNYPPPLNLTIETDFSRGGFSHNFLEMRRNFVPFHQFIKEKRERFHQNQEHQIQIENNNNNNNNYYYSDLTKVISPRSSLLFSKQKQENENNNQKQKRETALVATTTAKMRIQKFKQNEIEMKIQRHEQKNFDGGGGRGGCVSIKGFRNAISFSSTSTPSSSKFLPLAVRNFFTSLNNNNNHNGDD